MTKKLDSKSSIRDVLATLDNPVEYLRGIVGNMVAYKRERNLDDAAVRIGATGRGLAPHYRVEPTTSMVDAFLDGDIELNAYKIAFHGRSHKPWHRHELKAVSWSDTATPLAEVQQLLGELREAKKQKS